MIMSKAVQTRPSDAPLDEDPVMTPQEVAEYLGVHKAAVYRMMAEGRLRYAQVSPRYRRVRQSDVRKMLDAAS
jgi:excisionase family DNA binding protein